MVNLERSADQNLLTEKKTVWHIYIKFFRLTRICKTSSTSPKTKSFILASFQPLNSVKNLNCPTGRTFPKKIVLLSSFRAKLSYLTVVQQDGLKCNLYKVKGRLSCNLRNQKFYKITHPGFEWEKWQSNFSN